MPREAGCPATHTRLWSVNVSEAGAPRPPQAAHILWGQSAWICPFFSTLLCHRHSIALTQLHVWVWGLRPRGGLSPGVTAFWVPGPWAEGSRPQSWARICHSPAPQSRKTWIPGHGSHLPGAPRRGVQFPLPPRKRDPQSESEMEGSVAGNDLGPEIPIGSHQPDKSPSSLAQALISSEIQVKARPRASFPGNCGRCPSARAPQAPGRRRGLPGPTLLQCGGECLLALGLSN